MDNLILDFWNLFQDIVFGLEALGDMLTMSMSEFLRLGNFVDVPGLPDLADLQQLIDSILARMGLDVSVLSFLFGTGITFILSISVLRWFIGWITGA